MTEQNRDRKRPKTTKNSNKTQRSSSLATECISVVTPVSRHNHARILSDLTPQNDFSNQIKRLFTLKMRTKRYFENIAKNPCVKSGYKSYFSAFLRLPHIFLFIVKKAVQFAFFTTGHTLSITVPFVIGFWWLFGACFSNTNSLRCGRHDARSELRCMHNLFTDRLET